MYYLSTSKVAVAVLANLAFALALILYHILSKVRFHLEAKIPFISGQLGALPTTRTVKAQ